MRLRIKLLLLHADLKALCANVLNPRGHRVSFVDAGNGSEYHRRNLEGLPERDVTEVLKRFPFSEPEATKLKATCVGCHTVILQLGRRPRLKPAETYRLLSGLSDETLLGLMAKSKCEVVKRQVSVFLTTYQHVKPVVTGLDLKAMGLKPGPQFKKILDRLLDARLNGDVKTESDEHELARRLANRSG